MRGCQDSSVVQELQGAKLGPINSLRRLLAGNVTLGNEERQSGALWPCFALLCKPT